MLANEGEWNGVRILSRRTVRYMRRSQLTDEQKKTMQWASLRGHGYGNFMRVLEDEGQAPSLGGKGEFGWDGWLGCYMEVVPEQNMTFLMMTQKKDAGTYTLSRKIRNIIFSE